MAQVKSYVVGQNYHDGYWQKDFIVLKVDGIWVTIQWEDGKTSTHCTPLDERDIPFTDTCPAPRHGDCIRNRKNNWGNN
jgi:hypothetical protein